MSLLNISIQGAVQGVGYRYHVARRATESELKGWVKNRSDGTLEIEAVGPKETLEGFLNYVRIGPPGARVEGVSVRWGKDDPTYPGFDIRY